MKTQQLEVAELVQVWTLKMRSMARSAYSDRFIISQISNAALSAHLNLVEGHASIYPAEQLKFFSTARGSVAEALAGMAILEAEGRVPRSVAEQLRADGDQISRMLWGLMRTRMKKQG